MLVKYKYEDTFKRIFKKYVTEMSEEKSFLEIVHERAYQMHRDIVPRLNRAARDSDIEDIRFRPESQKAFASLCEANMQALRLMVEMNEKIMQLKLLSTPTNQPSTPQQSNHDTGAIAHE